MAIQHSVAVRNAKLDAIETTIGASPKLELRTGTKPANCAAATTGTLIALMDLPSDFLGAAAAGVKSKAGTWEDLTANAAGAVGYYRIFANDGTTCHEQGTVTETGGGGDMIIDNIDVEAGQKITVTSYALTEGNA
jgi:hypothetical protein